MAGIITGSLLIGTGLYSIAHATAVSNEILQSKIELNSSSTPFNNISNVQEGKQFMTTINTESNVIAGILDIKQKRKEQYTKSVFDTKTFEIRDVQFAERTYWESHSRHTVGLNLQLANFVPPASTSNILFTENDESTISAPTAESLVTRISAEYGVNLGLLPTGTYKGIFRSCGDGKPVFAIGSRKGEKFNSTVMGTNPKIVVDHVFKNQESSNDGNYLLGVMGVVAGTLILGGSLSK